MNDTKLGTPGMAEPQTVANAVNGSMSLSLFNIHEPDKATNFNDSFYVDDTEAVRHCTEVQDAWPVPEPLFASHAPAQYPLEALPETILEAVKEVVGFVKCPVPLAAASALSVVSVALQGLYDVERAPGLKGPCSLYLLAIAESGERKTTCDSLFKEVLEAWQHEEAEKLKADMVNHQAALAAWEAKRTGVLDAIKKAGRDGKATSNYERDLRDIEQQKPLPIRVPRLIRGDDTPEGLSWSLMREWPSAGVLSSEAGVVFGSHAMTGDSVTRNLALLNVLWDGGSIHVGRRTSDSYTVEAVRLTMGLQVQESTLRAFFDKSKGLARGTGFLARMLVSWPASTMGTRMYTEAPDWSRLARFHQRVRHFLGIPLNIDDAGRLATVTLGLSETAHEAWVKFQNDIEKKLAPDGDLQDVKDVASKVADYAARLAAIFHVFEQGMGAVSADAMRRGAKVAAWHLTEARRFLGQFALPMDWVSADRLEQWVIQYCQREGVTSITTRTALQYGPLRDKAKLEAAVNHLEEHGRARIGVEGRRRLIEINPALLGTAP